MTREQLQACANEIDDVLRKYDVSLDAESGNGPVQIYAGYEPFRAEIEIEGLGFDVKAEEK